MGYFRLTLALLIMVAHLGPRESLWPELLWWRWCVFAFYLISGYLMVLLTQGPYRGHRWQFLLSRALRVYPVYWATIALTLVGFLVFGPQGHFQQWMGWPAAGDMLPQWLLIINLDTMPFVPVPVAWALSVEAAWWVAIAFGIFDQRRQTYILLALFCVAYLMSRPDYYSLQWGAVPFAAGASLYWVGVTVPRDGHIAAMTGALSYPVFLVHYQMGAFIAAAYDIDRGWPLFWLSILPTLCLSWLMVLWVEQPIASFRKSLRSKSHGF